MEAALPLAEEQRIITRERLRWLEIGYYIRAGMGGLFGVFMLLYVAMFFAFSFIPENNWANGNGSVRPPASADAAVMSPTPAPPHVEAPPVVMFRVMGCVVGGFVLLMWVFAAATAYAGRCLRQRRRRLFIQIVAGLNCLFVPYGTFLGVMTFLTFGSPAGRAAFEIAGKQQSEA